MSFFARFFRLWSAAAKTAAIFFLQPETFKMDI